MAARTYRSKKLAGLHGLLMLALGACAQTADLANEVSWDPASENRLAQLFGVPIPEKNPDISPLPISSDGLLAASAAYVNFIASVDVLDLASEAETTVAIQLALKDPNVEPGADVPMHILQSKTYYANRRLLRLNAEKDINRLWFVFERRFGIQPDLDKMQTQLDVISKAVSIEVASLQFPPEGIADLATAAARDDYNVDVKIEAAVRNRLVLAQSQFAHRRELRLAGRETALNVLDAELDRIDQSITLVDTKAERIKAGLKMLHAAGKLDEASIRRAFANHNDKKTELPLKSSP